MYRSTTSCCTYGNGTTTLCSYILWWILGIQSFHLNCNQVANFASFATFTKLSNFDTFATWLQLSWCDCLENHFRFQYFIILCTETLRDPWTTERQRCKITMGPQRLTATMLNRPKDESWQYRNCAVLLLQCVIHERKMHIQIWSPLWCAFNTHHLLPQIWNEVVPCPVEALYVGSLWDLPSGDIICNPPGAVLHWLPT